MRGKLRNPDFGNILYRFFILVRDLIKFEIVFLLLLLLLLGCFIGILGESFEI